MRIQYKPENYKATPQPKRNSTIIIQKREPPHYHIEKNNFRNFESEEELFQKLERIFDEKIQEKLAEIFGERVEHQSETNQENLDRYLENREQDKTESINDNKSEITESIENIPIEDAEEELHENHVSEEEVEKDMMLEDDVEVLSEMRADEELDYETLEEKRELPPEEVAEPDESLAEIAESTLQNPTMAEEIPPEIWPEIEDLMIDLEAEELEDEPIEPSY